jgi:uncharacterized protein YlxW (UPF0749 family)
LIEVLKNSEYSATIEESLKKAKKNFNLQVDYEKLSNEVEKLGKEINELKILSNHKLTKGWQSEIGELILEYDKHNRSKIG